MLADAAGVVAKKQPVQKPCRLCPAEDKKRSYYGHWDEVTTTWAFYCCTSCFQNLNDHGEDVSNLISARTANKLKDGATALSADISPKHLSLPWTAAIPGCTRHAQ